MDSTSFTTDTLSPKPGAFYVHIGVAYLKHRELLRLKHHGFHVLVLDDVGLRPPDETVGGYRFLGRVSVDQFCEAVWDYSRETNLKFAQAFTLAEGSVELLNTFCVSMDRAPVHRLTEGTVRNKYQTRKRLEAFGVKLPYLALARNASEIPEISVSAFPLVVKPVDSMESRCVSKVENNEDLRAACQKVFESRTTVTGDRGTFDVESIYECDTHALIESCLPGREYSTEVLVFNGRAVLTFVTIKNKVGFPKIYEVAQTSGAEPLSAEQFANLQKLIDQLISANRYVSTILHIEFYATLNGDIHLVECNSRMGGDQISTLVYEAYGIDLVHLLLVSLDHGTLPEIRLRSKELASIYFLSTEEQGRLEIRASHLIDQPIHWTSKSGEEIKPFATERVSRVGYLFFRSQDLAQSERQLRQIELQKGNVFSIL